MPFLLVRVLRQMNADEFSHWPHSVDLRCVLILLCLSALFSQVVSFLYTFRSKFVCVSHVDHACYMSRSTYSPWFNHRIYWIQWIVYIMEVLLSTLMYFPVSFSQKYTMKEDFQYRNCCIIWNHYMSKVSLRTNFDQWHIKLRIWRGGEGAQNESILG